MGLGKLLRGPEQSGSPSRSNLVEMQLARGLASTQHTYTPHYTSLHTFKQSHSDDLLLFHPSHVIAVTSATIGSVSLTSDCVTWPTIAIPVNKLSNQPKKKKEPPPLKALAHRNIRSSC